MAEQSFAQEFLSSNSVLERIRQANTEEELSTVLFDLARVYAPALGIDFDTEVSPYLTDFDWWVADYGVSEVDGKAIGMSIKDAFRCLVDTHRTFQLSKGIKETIKEMKKAKAEGENVTAIDAGTGTGILSILLLAHGVDNVYAIEYNNQTYEITKAFLKQLGLDKRIILIEADATNIPLEEYGIHDADILVSENLSAGLLNEPQYAIISHLSNYLSDTAEIIPYRADLSVAAGFADWDGLPDSDEEKGSASAQRLPLKQITTNTIPYAYVESVPGMEEPVITADVVLQNELHTLPINTLFVFTRLLINRLGEPVYLEPNAANFLGNDYAIQIADTITSSADLPVHIHYEVGRRTKYLNRKFTDGTLNISDEQN